jgi:Leucine-rich repeat (LRR) protein
MRLVIYKTLRPSLSVSTTSMVQFHLKSLISQQYEQLIWLSITSQAIFHQMQASSFQIFSIFILQGNKLSGTIPSSISNASKLIDLDLGDNSFSGLIPKPLGNLRLLKWLSIARNNLTIESSTPEFNFFSSLSNLAYLNF